MPPKTRTFSQFACNISRFKFLIFEFCTNENRPIESTIFSFDSPVVVLFNTILDSVNPFPSILLNVNGISVEIISPFTSLKLILFTILIYTPESLGKSLFTKYPDNVAIY